MGYKIDHLTPDELLKRVLYRDALILVINKPSGIPVHPANGNKHNLEHYFHLLQFGLPKAPVLAHRLDLGTSGCLILARHTEAARRVGELFTLGLIKKTYYALVQGTAMADQGHIDIALGKQSNDKRHWWMKPDPSGLASSTDFRVIARYADKSLLELTPHTGRTHQLRVHCQAMGFPIIGDYIYGPDQEKAKLEKLCLHAGRIEIPLYAKKAALCIEAPVPEHMLMT